MFLGGGWGLPLLWRGFVKVILARLSPLYLDAALKAVQRRETVIRGKRMTSRGDKGGGGGYNGRLIGKVREKQGW